MSVYIHEQIWRRGKLLNNSYKYYRVARSINGVQHQKYFPYTDQGHRDALAQDEAWARSQRLAKVSDAA